MHRGIKRRFTTCSSVAPINTVALNFGRLARNNGALDSSRSDIFLEAIFVRAIVGGITKDMRNYLDCLPDTLTSSSDEDVGTIESRIIFKLDRRIRGVEISSDDNDLHFKGLLHPFIG